MITTSTDHSVIWSDWTGSTATVTMNPWPIWVNASTPTTTTETWGEWVSVSDGSVIQRVAPSVEQLAEQDRIRTVRITANAKRVQEGKLRQSKAVKLLREVLDRKQKKEFDKNRQFYVRGGVSGNLYRVKHGRAGNVEMLDRNKQVKETFCIHPRIWCPNEDTMLTQKIMIEHMEDQFRSEANIRYH